MVRAVRFALLLVIAVLGALMVYRGAVPGPPPPTPSPPDGQVLSVTREQARERNAEAGGDVPPSTPVPDDEQGPWVRTEPLEPPDPSVERSSMVRVPSIYAEADIVSVGIDDEGRMELPASLGDVGLLGSTAPLWSQEGSTLLAGHVTYRGTHGVLHHLGRVSPGALVQTWDETGSRTDWVVTSVELFHKEALPAEIFDVSSARQLVLVTCGGEIVRLPDGSWTHESNIVVVAEPLTV